MAQRFAMQRRLNILQEHLQPQEPHQQDCGLLEFSVTSAPQTTASPAPSLVTLSRSASHEAVAIITIKNPPVNALSRQVLAELEQCFAQAHSDETCSAIVLASGIPVRVFATFII